MLGWTKFRKKYNLLLQLFLTQLLHVEPGITIGTLTSKLLPMGWTIPVVPELEFLTVGKINLHKFSRMVHSYLELVNNGIIGLC